MQRRIKMELRGIPGVGAAAREDHLEEDVGVQPTDS
jgi:hypothetical protein